MKVKSESEVAQSDPTLSDPTDCSLPGSSIHRKSTGVGCLLVLSDENFRANWILRVSSVCFCSENEGETDDVKHNKVTVTIPLKYEVMLTVHG